MSAHRVTLLYSYIISRFRASPVQSCFRRHRAVMLLYSNITGENAGGRGAPSLRCVLGCAYFAAAAAASAPRT